MSLALNPYQSPTVSASEPLAVEGNLAALARRMAVQAIAGLLIYGALCLPLHPMAPLFWGSVAAPLVALLVVASTLISAVLFDWPIRRVHPAWLVAVVQVLLNGSLFGMFLLLSAVASQSQRDLLNWLAVGGFGMIMGAIGSVMSLHLTLPVTWAAIHVARAWERSNAAESLVA